MLNPRRAKFYDFQVLTGALHTVYHESSALLKKYTRYFFQRDTSSKAIAIGISEVNPLVYRSIAPLLFTQHVSLPNLVHSKF